MSDAFIFGSLKAHAQLFEASNLLIDKNGNRKSFHELEQELKKLNVEYNNNYLEAEYQFATSSSVMADKWNTFSDRYDLQYRTAKDSRVREEHQILHGTTLPKEDSFWDLYYPPNGWRCRCTVVQVRKGKYEASDSAKAIKAGEKATSQIGKDGSNRLAMFRFNAGKNKQLFPTNHPYSKVKGADKVKDSIEKRFYIKEEVKNIKDINIVFSDFAEVYPEYFNTGFKHIKSTTKKGVNGYTYMQGDVYLKKDRLDHVRDALNNIRKNIPTTLLQEDALSTLHHEMWHNANKIGNMRLTSNDTKIMELANEFISRKTLPEFMQKLGGSLQNKELVNSRTSTGYNKMVRNYDKLIEWAKVDKKKHLKGMTKHLINEKYSNQLAGLIDQVKVNSEFDISVPVFDALIKRSITMSEDDFEKLLKINEKLLVKKGR